MTDEQLQATFNDALDLSKKTGKSFEEVVQIMTAGAQAGLGKTREEMLAVTEQALHMSVAWGVAPEEAGKSLATWQASMNLTMAQSKELADTINVLSDNMNAEAGEINSITTRMGPLMQSMGFGTRGIAAFSAAFKAAGVDVSSAGTGLKNMTKVMVAGSAGLTKERRQIFAGLGINPDVLAKQMVDDAEGATVMVLDALSKVAPEKLSSLSMRLFGDESIVAIAPMIKNLNLLKGAITTAYGNVDDSVLKEYNNRMSTTAAAVSRSTANIRGLGIEIGNTLLPAIQSGTGMVDRFVSGIRGCVREHPRLTKAVVIGASALAALSVAGLVGAYAFSGLKSAWLGAKGAALLLTGAETRLWAVQKAGAVSVPLVEIRHQREHIESPRSGAGHRYVYRHPEGRDRQHRFAHDRTKNLGCRGRDRDRGMEGRRHGGQVRLRACGHPAWGSGYRRRVDHGQLGHRGAVFSGVVGRRGRLLQKGVGKRQVDRRQDRWGRRLDWRRHQFHPRHGKRQERLEEGLELHHRRRRLGTTRV